MQQTTVGDGGQAWLPADRRTQPLDRPDAVCDRGGGRVQSRGEPVVTIRAGDVIHIPGGEWHWHGAAADHLMTHLSMSEGDAEWGEHVSDGEYHGQR